jgi:hypothetical protein
MTLSANGRNTTVSTKGATVDTVTAARASDIAAGAKIVVQLGGGNPPTATEVILLPTASKFVDLPRLSTCHHPPSYLALAATARTSTTLQLARDGRAADALPRGVRARDSDRASELFRANKCEELARAATPTLQTSLWQSRRRDGRHKDISMNSRLRLRRACVARRRRPRCAR